MTDDDAHHAIRLLERILLAQNMAGSHPRYTETGELVLIGDWFVHDQELWQIHEIFGSGRVHAKSSTGTMSLVVPFSELIKLDNRDSLPRN